MAALLVLLLLLAVPLTAFSTNDVYYVTADDAAGHEQSCPPHQICHNLSYYISQPDSYFTSDTTIIFLEGEHSFDITDLVQVNNVHNLTLKGQGHWPVAGAEDTVMQSTVIINCTRGRGGFHFNTSHNITVEGLTVINCGALVSPDSPSIGAAVFFFLIVENLFFHKNSIQHMTGYGLFVYNCDSVTVTNCSYYHSAFCKQHHSSIGSGVGITYNGLTQYRTAEYTLELSHSNMTKCCNHQYGGGIWLKTYSQFGSATVLFSHLVLSHNKASRGGGLAVELRGHDNVTLKISNCLFSHGSALLCGGGMCFIGAVRSWITVVNTNLVENSAYQDCEMGFGVNYQHGIVAIFLLNLNISHVHTQKHSHYGVRIHGCCFHITLNNTRMRFANLIRNGLMLLGESISACTLQMVDSQLEGSHNLPTVITLKQILANITNCTFSNNSGSDSVISIFPNNIDRTFITSSIIADNNMTGITLIDTGVRFIGRNVIQNNRNTEGAGIKLVQQNAYIEVDGELFLVNNTADSRGGAIHASIVPQDYHRLVLDCSIRFISDNSSVTFSGNRAGKGGSDIYNARLINCYYMHNSHGFSKQVGQRNTTSWYFDTSVVKYLHFSNTDRLSSMSSDPIMVCFCNTTSNLPDCSDRSQHHIQTYPGLEINPSIATVGYYGGASAGDVLVSAQRATVARYYGQSRSTCFQLHILLQNATSRTALVNIGVLGEVLGWDVSILVVIEDCPIGFVLDKMSGQCRCEQFLDSSNVKCNVSDTPFKFLRSGNSWFSYINNTQCITGTTRCPFDYCNRSNVSFDIMAPDHQCVANRAGILCGQCQSHLSIMLGSNCCGACSNWYLFLLPVFALAGIVLVAVLMFLNLSVSVGTINGLLFYANMVNLNEVFFFPNGSVPVVSQFISWLNLDLGIEVCLFDGLDGYWNTWLQFAFPAYLFLLMGGIIVGCRYSVWLCRLCGSHAVPALATLFLMSYTKILLTVTNALYMSQLPCNGSMLTVWSVDGKIEYGSGKHLVLVLISCGVLVVGLAYPVLVLCAPLLERYSHKCIPQHRWNPVARLKPLLDAYGGPYKDKYRLWTGVTLMVRLILTVTFSFTSGKLAVTNASIIITVVVGIFIFWSFANGVYKEMYLSILEAFHLLNLFLLSTVSLTIASLNSSDYQKATIASVSLCFVVCLVTMAMHLWWNFNLKKIKRRLGFKDHPKYIPVPQVSANEADEEDRPPPGSPPSIVYGSRRGEHQFELVFPDPSCDNEESSSPVLLAREPLLFDT